MAQVCVSCNLAYTKSRLAKSAFVNDKCPLRDKTQTQTHLLGELVYSTMLEIRAAEISIIVSSNHPLKGNFD